MRKALRVATAAGVWLVVASSANAFTVSGNVKDPAAQYSDHDAITERQDVTVGAGNGIANVRHMGAERATPDTEANGEKVVTLGTAPCSEDSSRRCLAASADDGVKGVLGLRYSSGKETLGNPTSFFVTFPSDLTDGGTRESLSLFIDSTREPVELSVTVWDDKGFTDTVTKRTPPAGGRDTAPQEVEFLFSEFSGIDFSRITELELGFSMPYGVSNLDFRLLKTANTPEPLTLALFGAGLAGLGIIGYRYRS